MYLSRGKVKFSRKDMWCLPGTLGPIISQSLKQFKEELRNDPFVGVPCGGRNTHSIGLEDEEVASALSWWDIALDSMIYAFEASAPCPSDYDFEFVPGEGHGEVVDDRGSTRWNMQADNQKEYDRMRDDDKLHDQKVQEGLDLFRKYYLDLWT